jgi:site-specific recombinase XerD
MVTVEKFHACSSRDDALKRLRSAVDAGGIDQKEMDLITRFIDDHALSCDRFGGGRWVKYASRLRCVRAYGYLQVPWYQISFDDYKTAVYRLKSADVDDVRLGKHTSGPYSAETIMDYIVVMRGFCTWLSNAGIIQPITQEELRQVRYPRIPKPVIDGSLLLEEDVIPVVAGAASTARNRALIYCLYECAARPNEIAGIRWKDIRFADGCAEVTLWQTKTLNSRKTLVSMGMEALIGWMDQYAAKTGLLPEGENIVFLNTRKSPMKYDSMVVIVRNAMRAAKLRPVPPYSFRKSKITNMVLQGVPELVVKEYAWGNQYTTAANHYIRMTQDDALDAIKVHLGYMRPKSTMLPVVPELCPVCRHTNGPDANYCRHCGSALREELRQLATDADGVLGISLQDPDVVSATLTRQERELFEAMARKLGFGPTKVL